MNKDEQKIMDEIWSNCGEWLEQIDPSLWSSTLMPMLIRMIAKQREDIDHLKKLNRMVAR